MHNTAADSISATKSASSLKFSHVDFAYGDKGVVRDFCLDVQAGSFTTLLGPSGCGKTTLLRLAAGFLNPSAGSILIDDVDQTGIAPNLRNVAFVFQDYALFPHMTVADNILYGLRLQKKGKVPAADRLAEVLAMVDLSGFEKRFPHELSGGQQQRAALARSLILEPGILLMDEPLSSLDAKLRTQVREELRELQQKLHITTVYVTHDQEEAFSLSDTIAVMNNGTLLQSGTPRHIYYHPASTFVAEFTGRANIINGQLIRPEWFSLSPTRIPEPVEGAVAQSSDTSTGSVSLAGSAITGTVQSVTFLGTTTRIKLQPAPTAGNCAPTAGTAAAAGSSLIAVDLPTATAPLLTVGQTVTVYPVHSWSLP